MKAKLLTATVVVVMTLSTPLFADSSHHREGKSGGTMSSNSMGMMDMEEMHDHMARMQAIMKKIHATKDKAEQQKLMQQHMQAMREGMNMMSAGKAGGMGNMGGMQGNHQGMMDGGKMKDCHSKMGQRMEMMQGMMGQMMEHMNQQQNMNMKMGK